MSGTPWQWGLLVGFIDLLIYSVYVALRYPSMRGVAYVAASLSITHIALYASFVVWPDALNAVQTMNLSIVARYQMLVTLGIGLAIYVRRNGRW